MPTTKAFEAVAPFPEEVSVYKLPRLLLSKLLSDDPEQSRELFASFRAHGFALLDMQGCAKGDDLLQEAEKMFEVTREVTVGLDVEEKMKYEASPKQIFGYSRIGKTKTEDGLPDRFECYGVNNDDILGNVPPTPKPEPIERNRESIKSYIENAYEIGVLIMNQLDQHLCLPKGTLASLQRLDRPSRSQLRMLRYPPQPEGDRRTAFLGHTDFGTLTILFNIIGGLQILPPGLEAKDENWRYIKPEPGCAILNLGDAMVEWTGGILRSNLHRVYFAPGAQAEYERYSLAYAIRPEGSVSMKRLNLPGSLIPPLNDGEQELECDASEWGTSKAIGLMSGKDTARSRGGRAIMAC
ncbi:MAG: hypothetical protein ASARMPRED_002975 [Alectoria sarmentosa]|nr:MAG: hypothetical protein ASARMPRED_002975 [Alectoria sarmentosa]